MEKALIICLSKLNEESKITPRFLICLLKEDLTGLTVKMFFCFYKEVSYAHLNAVSSLV